VESGLLHAAFRLRGRWDGWNLRDLSEPPEEAMARVEEEWSQLYGADTFERVRFWASYLLPQLGPHRGEPFLTLMPWVLARSSPGWSAVLDGKSFANLEGLRGVIATDIFPNTAPEYQFCDRGEFSIEAGAAIARVLPVPRSLLQSNGTEIVIQTMA
jgi:hypothetical protein